MEFISFDKKDRILSSLHLLDSINYDQFVSVEEGNKGNVQAVKDIMSYVMGTIALIIHYGIYCLLLFSFLTI